MEILIMLGLVFLNGLLAMAEIAIVSAKKSRLMVLAGKGNRTAETALKLAEDPTHYLSTVQIGITAIGIMNGIFGESVMAAPFASWLQTFGLSAVTSDHLATVLVVVVVTYVTIVAGELVPKRIGQVNAEAIACATARPMNILAIITRPFVMILSGSTRALMRLLGFDQPAGHQVTEEEIHAILDEGSSFGILEQQEHRMVKNVLLLEERPITSFMVPRSDLVFLDTALSIEENYQRVMASPHSRFPVCERNSNNLIGIISARELLASAISGKQIDLKAIARPCRIVPESLTGMQLLELFRTSHSQMIFVVDEYGDLKGIVTLQDFLEALTGEFQRINVHDADIVRRSDGSLLLDGMLSVYELRECLQLDALPEEGHYQTLNGLMMLVIGRIPSVGEHITLPGWELEIVDMDGLRIDKVLATPLKEDTEDEGTAAQ